jgi:hypothetical protein
LIFERCRSKGFSGRLHSRGNADWMPEWVMFAGRAECRLGGKRLVPSIGPGNIDAADVMHGSLGFTIFCLLFAYCDKNERTQGEISSTLNWLNLK